MNKKGH